MVDLFYSQTGLQDFFSYAIKLYIVVSCTFNKELSFK